jgi:hypothetical protein
MAPKIIREEDKVPRPDEAGEPDPDCSACDGTGECEYCDGIGCAVCFATGQCVTCAHPDWLEQIREDLAL